MKKKEMIEFKNQRLYKETQQFAPDLCLQLCITVATGNPKQQRQPFMRQGGKLGNVCYWWGVEERERERERERKRVGKLIRGNGKLLIDEEKRNDRI